MFILSKNSRARNVIASYLDSLDFVNESFSRISKQKITSGYHLYWVSIKPSDNLHIFNNGMIIGKINFNEICSNNPINHNFNLPNKLHPLLNSIIIKFEKELIIKPNEHALIYYSSEANISDFQLLIAKLENRLPSYYGSVILGTIGYFPGNLTLFDEIMKIPYLQSLSIPALKITQHTDFIPQKSDDDKMINRLIQIIPDNKNLAISLSGGLDSRFILSLILKKGLRPKVYTMEDNETDIVKKICEKLELELVISDKQPFMEYDYTLMTDGRIYFRGGNYSRMINNNKSELLHNGLWSDPIIENAFKTAWKKPGLMKTLYIDLIKYALLGNVQREITGYKKPISKKKLISFLNAELKYGQHYYHFKSRKQASGWFYHLHRGLNWTAAHMADVSFFTYPIYLLGDRIATEYGITSPAYSNFGKERLHIINRNLQPNLNIDYSDGRKFNLSPIIVRDVKKLYFEYIKRFYVRLTDKNKMQKGYKTLFSNVSTNSISNFTNYFSMPLEKIILSDSISANVKRAAITINNVLKFI